MRLPGWQVGIGSTLIALSLTLYFVQYLIFRTPDTIAYYFFQDLAFLPIEVILVSLVIHRILSRGERRARLNKMNMVIGAYFNEMGSGLIDHLIPFLDDRKRFLDIMSIRGNWDAKRFEAAAAALRKCDFEIDSRRGNLGELKQYLACHRGFLLRLLENPMLIEHDSFTDLLWAVFHLADELEHRPELEELPETDFKHLSLDIHRAYSLILIEWLSYMLHLKREYPYLFSLAVRTNPFDPEASIIVR